jgi:heat shock protein HslJ/uncharacterized lipoprotein YbaY
MSHAHKSATSQCFLNCLILLAVILVMVQPAPAQDASSGLFGKTWTLTEMEGRNFSADKPNIEFNRDTKRVSGSGGCNRFSGTFEVNGSLLKFSPIASTKMACLAGDVQRVETSFLNLLQKTTRFEVEGDKLRLYAGDAGDGSVLVFVDRAANSQTGATTGVTGRVTGTITYHQRIALTSRAVVEVKLVDTSRFGGPPITIAEETIKLAGRQVPITFELTYDAWRIGPHGRYSVRVRILDRNKVRFRSTDDYLVITDGHPNKVNVIVKPTGK